jgi:hypothetical protein
VLALIVAILGFAVIGYELKPVKDIAKSQNNISLGTMFFNDTTNLGIIDAIEHNKPILKKMGRRREIHEHPTGQISRRSRNSVRRV